MNKLVLTIFIALIACFTLCAAKTAQTEADIKIGKLLGKVGKGALKIGKLYANAHGIPLSDAESEKKIDIDKLFSWISKGKQIYDLFKGRTEEEEAESDIKLGKFLGKVGKGALKIGKAYVGQKYGIQLSDEELADKKISIEDVFGWIEKGKKVHDILKGLSAEQIEEESDKKISLDEIFSFLEKGKKIYDIFKSHKAARSAPVEEPSETESDKIKIGKVLGKIGKSALKIGKAYVGQKYGIQLSDEELEADIKLGKALSKIGKGALKIGKAYVGQKYGIQLSETMGPGDVAASFARQQVGKGYSQSARLGPHSFDCSGLVKTAWAQAGRSVPNTTSGYPGGLRRVGLNEIQSGDILWRSGHVGIYVGGGQVVNAENPRSGVQIRSLDWYQRYMGVSAVYRP